MKLQLTLCLEHLVMPSRTVGRALGALTSSLIVQRRGSFIWTVHLVGIKLEQPRHFHKTPNHK